MKFLITFFLLLFTFLVSGYSHVIPVSTHLNHTTVHHAYLQNNNGHLINEIANFEFDDETEDDESAPIKKTVSSFHFKKSISSNLNFDISYRNKWRNHITIDANSNRYLLLNVLKI